MATSPIIDYSSLTAYLINAFERTNDSAFTGATDQFIAGAESSFTPQIISRFSETTATLTTDSAGNVPLPADFYRLRGITSTINGVNTYLPPLGPNAVPGNYPISTGDPTSNFYISGSTIHTVPGMDAQDLVLDYYAKFTPLSASNPTNWIIISNPTLYQFASMAQAAAFLQDWSSAAALDAKAKSILTEVTDYFALDYTMSSEVNLDTVTP